MPMNKLFYGDNLDVMRKFIRDETVDLCYIDPPFNSKRNYNQIYNNIGTEDRSTGPDGVWLPSAFTRDSRRITPGTMYTIQVRGLGGLTGQSDWSNPIQHMSM